MTNAWERFAADAYVWRASRDKDPAAALDNFEHARREAVAVRAWLAQRIETLETIEKAIARANGLYTKQPTRENALQLAQTVEGFEQLALELAQKIADYFGTENASSFFELAKYFERTESPQNQALQQEILAQQALLKREHDEIEMISSRLRMLHADENDHQYNPRVREESDLLDIKRNALYKQAAALEAAIAEKTERVIMMRAATHAAASIIGRAEHVRARLLAAYNHLGDVINTDAKTSTAANVQELLDGIGNDLAKTRITVTRLKS